MATSAAVARVNASRSPRAGAARRLGRRDARPERRAVRAARLRAEAATTAPTRRGRRSTDDAARGREYRPAARRASSRRRGHGRPRACRRPAGIGARGRASSARRDDDAGAARGACARAAGLRDRGRRRRASPTSSRHVAALRAFALARLAPGGGGGGGAEAEAATRRRALRRDRDARRGGRVAAVSAEPLGSPPRAFAASRSRRARRPRRRSARAAGRDARALAAAPGGRACCVLRRVEAVRVALGSASTRGDSGTHRDRRSARLSSRRTRARAPPADPRGRGRRACLEPRAPGSQSARSPGPTRSSASRLRGSRACALVVLLARTARQGAAAAEAHQWPAEIRRVQDKATRDGDPSRNTRERRCCEDFFEMPPARKLRNFTDTHREFFLEIFF